MSLKKTKSSNSSERRNLLKTAVIGGSAITATSHLAPKEWVSPLVNAIVLPTHAQTSVSATGTFGGSASIALSNPQNMTSETTLFAEADGIEHKILEFLVPSAQASHAREGWCNGSPPPELTFAIDASTGDVSVCAQWSPLDEGTLVDSIATTISDLAIADFVISGGDDGADEGGGIRVSNCAISVDFQTVTGEFSSVPDEGNEGTCMGSFSCPRIGDEANFSCSDNTGGSSTSSGLSPGHT